jgi:hypothetical protein
MTTFHVSPAATVTSIVILGAVVVGGTRERPTSSVQQPMVSIQGDRCTGGTEVSSFVCRNTWMASTRHTVR